MTRIDSEDLPGKVALEKDAATRLAQAGIRASAERIRALSLLMKFSDRAWTVQDLGRLGNGEEASLAAIARLYRSLHLLEERGIVKREVRETRGRPSFAYRLAGQKSAVRFQCRACNRHVATDSAQLRAQVERAGVETGLPISSGEMLVLVTCSRCAAAVDLKTNGLQ